MTDQATLLQLGEVQGQLTALMRQLGEQHRSTQELLNHHHVATNQRIDDLRLAMTTQNSATEKRVDSLSGRVTTLESNERSTALKAAGISAISGGLVAAVLTLLKLKP